jgi:hypothetical protein
MHRATTIAFVWVLAVLVSAARGDAVDDQLAAIATVGQQAAGSAAARAARDQLAAQDAAVLPRLLTAMQTRNPVAANWYRSAYEAIVQRELTQSQPTFPLDDLRTFVKSDQHAGRVRRLALSLCERLQPGYSAHLIPQLLNDSEFRADAVDAAMAAADQALQTGDKATALARYETAFKHARASEQVVRAADKLTALGQPVDIGSQLGLVVDWWVIGPFDAPLFSGFDRSFPPQQGVDLNAEYTGQVGNPLRWVRYHTSEALGLADLVQALGPATEAVGFAYATLDAPRDIEAQLRCGADDNCTVWLNGEQVFARQQWLNGIRFDRFVAPVKLRRGENRVLVKICQGPQHKNPDVPNNWSLQLRFCDADGTGLGLKSTLPSIDTAR